MVLAAAGPWWIGNWIKYFRPRRVVYICNLPDIEQIHNRIRELESYGLQGRIHFAYAAEWIRSAVGRPGPVLISPIDIERFRPLSLEAQIRSRPFTIGRLSRDIPYKHHPDDSQLYQRLAQQGFKVRVMGGDSLRTAPHPNIEILPEGAMAADDFLRSLDVFFYRTNTAQWVEPHGRVVTEALATGLPVICGDLGGFIEWVRPGKNGYIISDNQEAESRMLELRSDPKLYVNLSIGARDTAESAFSREAIDRLAKHIIGDD